MGGHVIVAIAASVAIKKVFGSAVPVWASAAAAVVVHERLDVPVSRVLSEAGV